MTGAPCRLLWIAEGQILYGEPVYMIHCLMVATFNALSGMLFFPYEYVSTEYITLLAYKAPG